MSIVTLDGYLMSNEQNNNEIYIIFYRWKLTLLVSLVLVHYRWKCIYIFIVF